MKSFLMTSVAATVLSLGLAAPATADCAADIAALKAQTSTGSINSTDLVAQPAAQESTPTAASATAATTPVQTVPTAGADTADQTASAASDQGVPAAGMAADQVAAADSAASAEVAPGEGGAPAPGTIPGTEATAAMNKVTEGIATSPAEVGAQQTAQPAETAPSQDQIAEAGQPVTPSTSPTSGGEAVNMQATILARAEAYQQLGNEGACMNAVEQAKAAE